MAAGDIVYARVPITIDSGGTEDSAVTTVLAGLFPVANYALVHTSVQNITGNGGRAKLVLIVVAQAIT